MSRTSFEFGAIIRSFLERNGFTFREAALRSGISATYWKDLSDGRVPSLEIIKKITDAFDDLDIYELSAAAGYAVSPSNIDPLKAVEIALRANKNIPQEGVKQILDFAEEIMQRYEQK